MSNTEIWDKLKRVPPEHLKGFKRAGGFKGTAIKPMWTIHRMTEVFGPVGGKWGIEEPRFQIVPAGDEILVFCTVSVWVLRATLIKDGEHEGHFYGVGGDKVRAIFSNGPHNDDEAFKKAYTDALTNALKMLGAGADVHMGLWDGNKYVDEKPEAEPAPDQDQNVRHEPAVMTAVNGTKGASKAGNRDAFAKAVAAIRNAPTLAALKGWYQSNVSEIDAMPPDFLDELRVEYQDRKAELEKALAA